MPNRFSIFFVFLLAYFLSYFFRSTNAVIADDLVRDLALSPQQLGSMTGVFFASFALVQFPLGLALDKYGARLTTGFLILFAFIGAIVFASAQSYTTLALGRALIGLGVSAALMGSLTVFSRWFPAKQFPTVSGIFVALGASGALLATSPLRLLVDSVGWRQVFYVGSGFALISAILILLLTRDAPKNHVEKQDASEKTSQGRVTDILTKPAFWQIAFLSFAVGGSFFAYSALWMGPFLTDILSFEPLRAGNYLFLLSACSIVGYFVSGWLSSRLGLLRTIAFTALAFFLAQLSLSFLTEQSPPALLVGILAIFGFTGAFNIMVFSHLRQIFPSYLTGRAFAFANFFGFAGIALMQWLLGVIISLYPLSPDGGYAASAFRSIFILTSSIGLLSVLCYLPLIIKRSSSKAAS